MLEEGRKLIKTIWHVPNITMYHNKEVHALQVTEQFIYYSNLVITETRFFQKQIFFPEKVELNPKKSTFAK